jgi:hypothetical protein
MKRPFFTSGVRLASMVSLERALAEHKCRHLLFLLQTTPRQLLPRHVGGHVGRSHGTRKRRLRRFQLRLFHLQ